MQTKKENVKICLVTSSGGHLFKTYRLKGWWSKYHRFWVTKSDQFSISLLKNERKYFAFFPENRNILNAIKNFFFAIKILRKEKPSLVFSAGAGIAPPFLLAAKLLGIRTIFLETFVYIAKQTLSGKLVHPWVDLFLVQNRALLKKYPRAKFWGATL